MDRLRHAFWDWATRNAIRLGTVVVVIGAVTNATYKGLKRKDDSHG